MRYVGLIGVLLLAGCSAGSGGGGNVAANVNGGVAMVTGSVTNGPVQGATVDIYTLDANGYAGRLVAGPVTTDVNGDWSAPLPSTLKGPFITITNGGSYVDEATGATLSSGLMEAPFTQGQGQVTISPISIAMMERVRNKVAAGMTMDRAITQSARDFYFSFGFDPSNSPPKFAFGSSLAGRKHMTILTAISKLLANNPTLTVVNGSTNGDKVRALARDLSDFKLDGLVNGKPLNIQTQGSTVAWPKLDSAGGLVALQTRINAVGGIYAVAITVAAPVIPTLPGIATYGTLQLTGGGTRMSGSAFVPTSVSSGVGQYTWSWSDVSGASSSVDIQINPVPTGGTLVLITMLYDTGVKNTIMWYKSYGGLHSDGLALSGITVNSTMRSVKFSGVTIKGASRIMGALLPLTLNGTLSY